MNRKNTYSRSKPAMSNTAKEKQYVIRWHGQAFKGSPEDVARWYCKRKGIKLYIDESPNGSYLLNMISPDNTIQKYVDGKLQDVQCVADVAGEDYNFDFEHGYRLFFTDWLAEEAGESDADFELGEVS